MKIKGRWSFWLALLALFSITCNLPNPLALKQSEKTERINEITFCKDVSDEGECIDPANSYPVDTQKVWALFTFSNMKDGEKWGRVWTQDGEVYSESRDEAWEEGEEGWLAYSLEDPDALSGHFTLSIYLEQKEVRSASFDVAKPEVGHNSVSGFAAFGPVTMAAGVSEENFPLGQTRSFEPETTEVYGVFAYINMKEGQKYTVEWMRDGEQVANTDSGWRFPGDGMYSCRLYDDNPLGAGNYILNLYIDEQIARSVNFEIQGTVEPTAAPSVQEGGHPDTPATPEEVVDAGALKYFYMVYNANLPVLKDVVRINLEHHTRVIITPDNPCGSDAVACFSKQCDQRYGGKVLLPAENLGVPDYVVAETLAHELTHGMEFYGGMACGCTVEKEYYAVAAEIDYLLYSGHEEYAFSQYGRLWDEDGTVRKDRLWEVVKKVYLSEDCPEY